MAGGSRGGDLSGSGEESSNKLWLARLSHGGGVVVMGGGLVEGAADVGHEVRAVQQEAGDVLVQDEAVSEC